MNASFDGGDLFSFAEHIDRAELASNDSLDTLVVTLGAYGDSGHVQRLLNDHILNSLPNHEVGKFDTDILHDYTGRRPAIHFEYGHFENYRAPQIVLHQVSDANGVPFLLLTGPEPSMRWERVAASIAALNQQLGVKNTVLLHAMPAPAPHTRPVWTHAYATRNELITSFPKMPAAIEMHASFQAVLTIRLGQAGQDVIGLVAQVPHYLADIEYPDAAIALIDTLKQVSPVELPVGGLAKAAAVTRALISPQVEGSQDLQEMIHQLEQRYEQFTAARSLPGSDALPSADEIGAEVEEFLRGMGDDDKPSDGPDQQF